MRRLIPRFHCMFFTLSKTTYKHFDIYLVDTDVLVLLMDLVSYDNLGQSTDIILHAGKAKKLKPIDVIKCEFYRERKVTRSCWYA